MFYMPYRNFDRYKHADLAIAHSIERVRLVAWGPFSYGHRVIMSEHGEVLYCNNCTGRNFKAAARALTSGAFLYSEMEHDFSECPPYCENCGDMCFCDDHRDWLFGCDFEVAEHELIWAIELQGGKVNKPGRNFKPSYETLQRYARMIYWLSDDDDTGSQFPPETSVNMGWYIPTRDV